MDQNLTLPDKKVVAETLLTKGNVFLHLDPRKEGVVVPDWLRDQLQLVLQIGRDLPIRIPDLDVGDDGVSATLSFNRSPFTCWVPWDSLFAMVGDNGRGMVWMRDMPAEIAAEIEREVRKSQAMDIPAFARIHRKRKRNGKDRALKELDQAPESEPKERPDAARTRKRRRVAGQKVKAEENPIAPAEESAPAVSAKKNHDSNSPHHRGERKPKARELPPYLRVIK
jgi:hypothetical protein